MSSVNINSPASNTINNQINLNEVIVVTSDNQINVTQPVTNVVEVVTLGPMGPGGGGGSNVNTGSFATTSSNTFYGNQIISGTSDFILQIHSANINPWAFGIYNDTYNPTQAVLAGFIWDDGRAAIGTEVDKPIEIYTNANYYTPTLTISSSGVTVNNTVTIQGGIDFGVKIGSGNSISLASDAYILMSSIANSPAGYTINRGDSTTYASIDLLTAQDVSKGWSIQTQPNSDNLFVLDREGSKNIISATPNNGGISINSDLSVTGSLNISGSITADNLWYRYTVSNIDLSITDTYVIVPITPGYTFVPMVTWNNTIGQTLVISNYNVSQNNNVQIGTPSIPSILLYAISNGQGTTNDVLYLFGNLPTQINTSTEPIIVTVAGGDTGIIEITITGYLKKI